MLATAGVVTSVKWRWFPQTHSWHPSLLSSLSECGGRHRALIVPLCLVPVPLSGHHLWCRGQATNDWGRALWTRDTPRHKSSLLNRHLRLGLYSPINLSDYGDPEEESWCWPGSSGRMLEPKCWYVYCDNLLFTVRCSLSPEMVTKLSWPQESRTNSICIENRKKRLVSAKNIPSQPPGCLFRLVNPQLHGC